MPRRNVDAPESSSGVGQPTAKERGCFQCSRRRIICDRSEPFCRKCIKKGIECSGLNRIRFTEAVARRGKLKDCKIPDTNAAAGQDLPTNTQFAELIWQNEKKTKVKTARARRRSSALSVTTSTVHMPVAVQVSPGASSLQDGEIREESVQENHQAEHRDAWNSSQGGLENPNGMPLSEAALIEHVQDLQHQPFTDSTMEYDDLEDVEEIIRSDLDLMATTRSQSIMPWLAPLSPQARMLFSHFSEAVAPVMVVLDSVTNGYRQLILPMAHEDEVLRRAVSVVAAQHLSRERPEMKDVAEAGRSAIIARLRKDSFSASPDQVFSKATWATLIVLLVGETVTGSSDYRFLVQMLLCVAANNQAAFQDPDHETFLQTQTNMFELQALPLLGEEIGVSAISRSFHTWQDWLTCEKYAFNSEGHRIIDEIRQIFAFACNIYLSRATSGESSSTNEDATQEAKIQELVDRVSELSPDAPGAHALVWPIYIAGAEASNPTQRTFCTEFLFRIYARTKFRNIPIAAQSLEKIWARIDNKRWTQCLPEYANVLIM